MVGIGNGSALRNFFRFLKIPGFQMAMSETLVPVVEVFKRVGFMKDFGSVATGSVLMYTIPANERWFVKGIQVFMSGANTCTHIQFYNSPDNDNFFLGLEAAAATTKQYLFLPDYCLEPGCRIYAEVTNDGSSWSCYFIGEREYL